MSQINEVERSDVEGFDRPEYANDGGRSIPRADIYETTDEFVVMCDMPGVKPEDVDVQYERGHLRLSGKVKRRRHQGRVLDQEYDTSNYARAFSISSEVDPTQIGADCCDGVVTLHFPKKEETKPKQIRVHHKG
ncbi:MAG TPA: Hsp20/alpha crystallin family protein [Gemmataceae bacterium]|nr:Hsp20/alpha crystallin family protein [Gemmataceae bacterium]